MSFALDENGTPFLDENGNNIEFNISYIDTNEWYIHREPLHINDNGHLDTEDRNLVLKDAINENHAVSLKQLTAAVNNLKSMIITKLQTHEAKILTQMLNFRNEQIKNRIQRKYLVIPKKVHTWLKLFDNTDVGDGVVDLNNVIVLNVWIKRWDRYHNAKSALLERDFDNSIEFFYNSEMTAYYTYFTKVPSKWDMSCIIEWLRIPKPIYSNENIPSKPNSNEYTPSKPNSN